MRLLLLRNTHGLSAAASGLGVLAAHGKAPVVAQTAMVPDLLQALQIVTQLGVKGRGGDLRVAAILDVLLPVEEPVGNLVCTRVADDGHDRLKLLSAELASPGKQRNGTRG